jgi:hypothetical protein
MPVNKLDANTECAAKAFESEAAVGLEKLAVCQDAHLSYVVTGMGRQKSRGQKIRLLKGRCVHGHGMSV